ncbi:hypothetical protein BCV70DRAFT_237030 [Testicularia cyperi]|uniref:AD domain-containing protein n=1 Tax=Testicularia cyperi TaxID=1882483 RepID=A0A317XSC7_9BASI|nr:hypothetical protein BCV70DRAFT_237030 [Testicularia cyperi]
MAPANTNSATSARSGAATPTPANQLANFEKLLGRSVTLTVGDKAARIVSGKLWAYDPSLGVVGLECPSESLNSTLSAAPAAAASVAQASQAARNPSSRAREAVGFKLVKVSEVKKIEFVASSASHPDKSNGSNATSLADSLTPIHPVSLKAAQMREMDAVKRSLTKVARTGKDVSEMGQLVFDALSKTLPCRWHGPHIIVMEEVVVSGPGYDPASTNVPSFTQDQLRSFIDGTHTGPVPEGAQSKANSWNRVTKVLEGERRKIVASQAAAGA